MKKTSLPIGILCLLLALLTSARASMTIQSLSGPVTATEISSFKTFMATQSPPTTQGYNNDLADGTSGMNCEALGLMYEVTNDPAILNEMISFADSFIALRNDYTDRRVMWDGNVDPVWLTTTTTSSDPGYAGCENNDIVGHIAYCAKLILQSPWLWNTTVPDGNPHGYGVTYLQRAQTYVTQMEQVQDQYMNPWFIDTSTDRIKNSTVVDPRFSALGQSTTAWNRQMMFIAGWQRLSECHAILGDNPAKLAFYDGICQASVSWYQTEWVGTNGGGQPAYLWDYAPSFAGGNEEMNLHAAYDMWGLGRAYDSGKYGMTQPLLRPFAETLRYIIYEQGTSYTFAEWVSGDTSKTRTYIYPQWMYVAAYDPCTFDIMAQADINQGSQGSTAIFDALILWVKNARYLGVYPSNCDAADFSIYSSWVENLASGTSTNYPVTITPLFGFGAGGVSLSMSGLPSGVSASFSPGADSTLTISASGSVPSGVYAATISGTGSGITRTLPITLVITNTGAPNFTISASPSSQNTTIGTGTSYTVTIGSVDGFSGNVALSVSGLPAHASGSFSPSTITGGSGTSTLNLTTATNTPSGNDTLTITGVSGTITNTTTVSLVLNDFAVAISPSAQSVVAGNSTNYTVTVGNINGFGGTVNLSANGLPTGATASFNPTSVNTIGSSTLTISTTASTPVGTSAFNVIGTCGNLMHGVGASLIVNPAGTITWTEVNDTDPSVTYSSGWSYGTNRNYGDYNNDVHYTTGTSNYAQYAFSGTGVEYITETYSDEGNVDVYLDGTYQTTVNCNSSTRAAQVVMYSNTGLSSGSHTLKVAKNSGTFMLVDAFAYTTAPVPDFAISATPSSQTVNVGGGTTYTATISATNGFSGAVALTVSGLPTGATASFNPTPVSGSGSSTLSVSTSSSTPAGSYTLTLTGTSGSLVHSTTVTLNVADFSISASPSSQTVTAGNNTTYTATTTALDGFNSSIALTVSGLPTGATASFNPASVIGSGSSTLTITTATTTPAGNSTLTITGTSGGIVHSTTVTLVVNVADFTISASPSSQTVTAGNNTTYTATTTALNGFNGSVALTVSGLPTGATGTFNPTSLTGSGSSTLTVTTSTNTPASTNTLTLTGTSGSLVHTATVTLIVHPVVSSLPSGWSDTDVGSPSPAGSATYGAGVFTVNGSGSDIWGTSDQFNYAYESLSGDGTIVARVATVQNTQSSAKAGIMIRETTAAGSTYAGLYITPSSGAKFEYRSATGGSAASGGAQTGITAPYWVKLARSGTTFTASISPDGNTWTTLGSATISMATAVNIGLPVCSHAAGTLCTATIDNVSVAVPSPDFSLSASPSSQTVTTGNNTTYTETVTALNGFSGSVALTISGLPAGATGTFNPTPVSGSGSSTLTVTTANSTPTGTYTLTLTGTSGSLVHSNTVTLVVNPPAWTEVNDTDPNITYSSGWSYSTNRNDGDYNNDVHYIKTAGASAQYSFTGSSIEYITETYSDEGNVDVYIDGTLQTTVNCNSSTRAAQVVMYSNTSLTYGSHTIKVVKNSGTYMLLDAFSYR